MIKNLKKRNKEKEYVGAERCEICGRYSENCKSRKDALGRYVYCVCSNCLMNSSYQKAVLARRSL